MTTFKNYEDVYKTANYTANYTATYTIPNIRGLAPRFEIWKDGEKVVTTANTYELAVAACDSRQAQHGQKKVTTKTEVATPAPAQEIEEHKSEDMITERQLVFIQQLMAEGKHLEGGFFHSDHPEKLTKKEASIFIKSLLGNY